MSIRPFSKVSIVLLVAVFLVGCGRGASSPATSDASPTVVTELQPTAAIGINREVAVLFSKPMNPASINVHSFIVEGATGTVAYDPINLVGSFTPTGNYAANALYNGTITTEATDTSGNPLAAPFNFSFTTRATLDTSLPTIADIVPAASATCVPLNQQLVVTFVEQMNSLTINPSTCLIVGVPGTEIYNPVTQNATFIPTTNLAANTQYTVSVNAGAHDLGGNSMAAPYSQTFTTGPCSSGGGATVALCPFIGNLSVLAGSTVTNTGSSVISGDVDVYPGTALVGFPPGLAGGTLHSADGTAATGQATLNAAYLDAAGRSGGTTVSGDLTGQTLTAGVYKSTSSLALSGKLTLDAKGNSAAVFIFQIGSTLTTGSGSQVILANGASACNIFWQVGSSATLGTYSTFNGNILALTSITITTGVNLQGRALAQTGAVTLDTDIITNCSCP